MNIPSRATPPPPPPPAAAQHFNPPFVPPHANFPVRGMYHNSPQLPSYRGNFNFPSQDSVGVRYGLGHTPPPFKSKPSPGHIAWKNGAGNHPPQLVGTASNVHANYHSQLPPAPRMLDPSQLTHEEKINECKILAQRMKLYPRPKTPRNLSYLTPTQGIPQSPPPIIIII
ncbi:hypothetical protein L9F63_023532 [Diploptera punctata]|uniref:Uncharacterized protein n=1 Tax=Diploptera punctata TaxID=6984 RepID=A0AAD7ZIS7_DIPPU|nr:hypothetical protein L9F63_023532 [Diploptera punctata]